MLVRFTGQKSRVDYVHGPLVREHLRPLDQALPDGQVNKMLVPHGDGSLVYDIGVMRDGEW